MKSPIILYISMFVAFPTIAPGAGASEEAAGATTDAPCLQEDAFRAFDFWIGEWEVRMPDGRLAGYNRIEPAQDGCVLVEQWTGAAGGSGMSMNYYDAAAGEWVQLWTGADGSQILVRGGPTGDGILLEGQVHYVGDGTTAAFRGLWTPLPDGRVRQFLEESKDGGKTWEPWFEGFYSRVEQVPAPAAVN